MGLSVLLKMIPPTLRTKTTYEPSRISFRDALVYHVQIVSPAQQSVKVPRGTPASGGAQGTRITCRAKEEPITDRIAVTPRFVIDSI